MRSRNSFSILSELVYLTTKGGGRSSRYIPLSLFYTLLYTFLPLSLSLLRLLVHIRERISLSLSLTRPMDHIRVQRYFCLFSTRSMNDLRVCGSVSLLLSLSNTSIGARKRRTSFSLLPTFPLVISPIPKTSFYLSHSLSLFLTRLPLVQRRSQLVLSLFLRLSQFYGVVVTFHAGKPVPIYPCGRNG